MIRSMRSVRRRLRSIRELSCDVCVFIPGRPGPVEPFHASCLGDDPAVWATIDRYAESAFRWDMGGIDGRPYGQGEVDDAVSLFRYHLFTTTAEQWAQRGIGYGDRFRALVAIRHKLKRLGWRDRFSDTARGRKATRRYRAYVASMSISEPSPARVAEIVESAVRDGVRGKQHGRGNRRAVTETLTAEQAREAIVGNVRGREIITGPRIVRGGTANVETDGRMKEVVIRAENYLFFTGERVNGRWVPDGKTEPMVDMETRFKMVRSYSEVEYPAAVVADTIDAGEWTPADTARAIGG